MKIGIVIIATNKYAPYIDPLIDKINQNLLVGHEKHIFVFTDAERESTADITFIKEQHRPWPCMTLFRYDMIRRIGASLKPMDYVYYIDADMDIIKPVGDEILGDLVAVEHYAFFKRDRRLFTYETNPASTAFMPPNWGALYYAGAFQGGRTAVYLNVVNELAKRIDIDYGRGIIAKWHDESHWNRYLWENPPTKTLSPSYCCYEDAQIPFEVKIVSVRKNEKIMKV